MRISDKLLINDEDFKKVDRVTIITEQGKTYRIKEMPDGKLSIIKFSMFDNTLTIEPVIKNQILIL